MGAFFSSWTEQRLKIGKLVVFSSVLLLCIYQSHTLFLLYQHEKNEYSKNFLLHCIERTIQTNLIKSSDSIAKYCSYNTTLKQVRIVKKDKAIDTIISINTPKELRIIECQGTYDIRDTACWRLDSLGQLLLQTLQTARLVAPFRLTLSDQNRSLIDTFSYQTPCSLLAIHKELELGFLERHHLSITFTYPFYLFWKVASDRIITTLGLFFLLITLSISLYQQLKEERRSHEYRKKFSHTLVHNLRSPLLSAKQHLTALKMLPLSPEKRAAYLDLSITNTENVLKDIERLLTLSVDAYGLVIHREPFQLYPLLEQLRNNYQQRHPSKEVTITINCPEELTISANKAHLTGALYNLVENSILYSGPKVHIYISCIHIKKKLWIRIEDNGFGISTTDLPHIFEENYRGKRPIQNGSRKGFGLGLYYVHMVVKAHRGKITAYSDGHSGTKIELEITIK